MMAYMKIYVALFSCLLSLSASVSAEQFKCFLVADDGKGGYRQDKSEYVDLSADETSVRSQIHIRSASKDLTFETCNDVRVDGSNFSRWFKTECKTLKSADKLSFTVEPFLLGAYAGISPDIVSGYSMYEDIKSVSLRSGINVPDRTIVIYASGKPLYEFFCYRQVIPHSP